MRYYLRGDTLFIRGSFRAVSSGVGGGIGPASTLLQHSVHPGDTCRNPDQIITNEIAREGLPKDFFGLLSPVELRNLCILNYDFITAFITAAGRTAPDDKGIVNIILCSTEGLTDGALISAIISVTEARLLALQSEEYRFPDTPAGEMIVAGEGEPVHSSAGPATEPGERIKETVHFGVSEALKRSSGIEKRDAPSFFILSRYGGQHWVEWQPEQCQYYPCHFEGQRCDFCYCPFYPCGDESLGHLVNSSSQHGKVWNCARCTLLHHPEIARYLKKYPEASLRELKSLEKKIMTGT
jgi:adenosylcobinamide hydrolase